MNEKIENQYNDLHNYFESLEFEKKYYKTSVYVDALIRTKRNQNITQGNVTVILKKWAKENNIFYMGTSDSKSFKLFKKYLK